MGFFELKVNGKEVMFSTESLYNQYFKGKPQAMKIVVDTIKNRLTRDNSMGRVTLDDVQYYHSNISERDAFAWRWMDDRLFIVAFGTRMPNSPSKFSWINR